MSLLLTSIHSQIVSGADADSGDDKAEQERGISVNITEPAENILNGVDDNDDAIKIRSEKDMSPNRNNEIIGDYRDNVDTTIVEDDKDYILGRPMTETEKKEQEDMIPLLHELPKSGEMAEPVLEQGRATASYIGSFDLRRSGLVTDVKDQMISGPCWAFASIAMAESAALKLGTRGIPDFSEEHLIYFFSHRVNDPLGNTLGDKNSFTDEVYNAGYDHKTIGGNIQLASKFLSTWSGVAEEREIPYSTASYPWYDDALAYRSALHLQDIYYIAPSVDEIKEILYTTQQSVGVSYCHGNSYYNVETGAYCCPIEYRTNHAVVIVGWDDDYRKENFTDDSHVTSDGAWIVKNSWGKSSGDGGYIYISYEDKSIDGAVSVRYTSIDDYDHNYQYDGSSGSSYTTIGDGGSCANIFQIKGDTSVNEILKAVGISVGSANTDLSVDIYTNLNDPNDPLSGVQVIDSQKVYAKYSGYYTFPLRQEIKMEKGTYFSVIFTNCSGISKKIGVERSYDSGIFKFEANVRSGQSFKRFYHPYFEDMSKLSDPQNIRIKAYTSDVQKISPVPTEPPTGSPTQIPIVEPTEDPTIIPTSIPTPKPTSLPEKKKEQNITVYPKSLVFYVGGKYKTLKVSNAKGKITYKSDDPKVAMIDAKGKVTPRSAGKSVITINVSGNNSYKPAVIKVTVYVKKKVQSPTVNHKSLQLYDKGKTKTLKVYKAKGKVTYKSSDPKVVKVDIKGRVTPKTAGRSTITIKAAGNSSYKAATIKVKVIVYKTPSNVSGFLRSYKQKNYDQARKQAQQLPSKAKEQCVRNMDDAIKEAYYEIVDLYIESYDYDGDPWLWDYFLTDINKDFIPELMIRYGTCEADVRSIFYTYKNNTAVAIGTVYVSHAGFFAYPDGNGLIVATEYMSDEKLKKITLSNGKVKMAKIGGRNVGSGAYMDIPYKLKSHWFWDKKENCEMIDLRDLL